MVGSLSELRGRLAASLDLLRQANGTEIAASRGIYSSLRAPEDSKVAVLFPGQGSQYPDMLREFAIYFPEVRRVFEKATRVLAGRFSRPLDSYIFPPDRYSPEDEAAARQALTRTDIAQAALGASGIASFHLLRELGIQPGMAAGHSYGEYVALCAAGVFSEEALYDISEVRGRLILRCSPDEPMGMAAIEADGAKVSHLIKSLDSVWLANLNAPNQTVVSGTKNAIEQVRARCEAAGIDTRTLAVSCAFHSPLIAAARDRLAEALSGMTFSRPKFPVYSNSTGKLYPEEPSEIARLLSSHLVNVVDFAGEVRTMYDAGARIFIEAGPRNALTGLVGQILRGLPHLAVAVDVPGQSGLSQLQHLAAQLLVRGVPIQLERLYRGRRARELKLHSLLEDTRPAAPAPTAWLVNGGRARPASAPQQAPAQPRRVEPPKTISAPSSKPDLVAPQLFRPQFPVPSDGHAERAVLQFQEVMAKILDTQREVMLAYMNNGNGKEHHLPLPVSELDLDSPASAAQALVQKVPSTPAEPLQAASENAADRGVEGPLSIREALLNVVSDRTGYPVEVLGLNQRIEADLGIDSLKATEILAAFRQSRDPEQQPLIRKRMDDLSKARTLGAMIELLEKILKPEADKSLVPKADEMTKLDAEVRPSSIVLERPVTEMVPRTRLVPVECVQVERQPLGEGSFLITDDDGGIAARLSTELRKQGLRVSTVRLGKRLAVEGTGSYIADLSDPDAVFNLVQLVGQTQGRLSGIIHLLPLKAGPGFESMDFASWRARLDQDVRALFLLAIVAGPDLKASAASHRASFFAATSMGGNCGYERLTSTLAPSHGGLAAMLKCLALEWRSIRCKAVDFEAEAPVVDVVSSLISELSSDDREVEVGYLGSKRFVLRSVTAARDEIQAVERPIDQNSVVLVTGGGHGITARFAIELARRYKPTLLIVGRSALPDSAEDPTTRGLTSARELKTALMAQHGPEKKMPAQIDAEYRRIVWTRELRRNLQTMRDTGAQVRYVSLDVRDELAFRALIQSLYETYGRIDGVVHGAGVIEDKSIENKTRESFDRVFETKVSSAFVLSRALRPESLKFLVFFSSVAARFGNPGQADYAAANGVLDKLAVHLDRSWPAHVFSIGWGPWAETGMVSPAVHEQFRARGIGLIPPSQGVLSLDWEIRRGKKGQHGVILGLGSWAAEELSGRISPVPADQIA